MTEKRRYRFIDRVSISLPSAVMFIGLMMMGMANLVGEYLMGAGVMMQLAVLVFKVPKLFR